VLFTAVVFLASPLAVPFVKLPNVFFGGAGRGAAPFLTTVELLPSLASLVALARRPVRVAGREVGGLAAAGAARRVLAGCAAGAAVLLVFDVPGAFRVPARVDLAFSTKLDSMLVAAAVREVLLSGEPGRAICDLAGETGRAALSLELEDVGDKTCAGRTCPPSAARTLLLGFSAFSFSLSLPKSSLVRLRFVVGFESAL